jgi:hypothetical protein
MEKLANEVGKVVSPTHQPPLPPWYSYLLSQPHCHSAAERIMSVKNSTDTIRNQTHKVPACSVVPEPTAPLRAAIFGVIHTILHK